MFVKKSSAIELPKIMRDKIKEEIKSKEVNHQFFLLVRDQKYEEAYALGMAYLEYFPENKAIERFCYFIQHNREELLKMIDEQQNYTDDDDSEQGSDDDSDEEEDQSDRESMASQKSSVSSKKSIISVKNQVVSASKSVNSSKSISSSKSSSSSISKGKQNSQICKIHKWNHICKNTNCPNKQK